MAKTLSINIEENTVKVVYASTSGRRVTVTDAITLPPEKLDDFLKDEKTRDVVVSAQFKTAFYDTVHIPPVKKNFEKTLIMAELQKRHQGRFTPVFFQTGQKTLEGKRLNEYFVYYVETSEVDELTQLFVASRKRLKALYPNMLAVLKLLPRRETPYLCLFETAANKTFFLIDSGQVTFTRVVQSLGAGLSDYDMQNINMTVSHCRQTLRTEPECLLYLGDRPKEGSTRVEPLVPVEFFGPPPSLDVRKIDFLSFLVPICALGPGKAESLFSEDFRQYRLWSDYTRYGTRTFALGSAALAIALALNLVQYQSLNHELQAYRASNRNLTQVMRDYEDNVSVLAEKKKAVDFVNRMNARPSPGRLMIHLDSIHPQDLDIRSFSTTAEDDKTLSLRMSGVLTTERLLEAQQEVNRMAETLAGIPGIVDVQSEMTLSDRSFQISGRYTEEAP